MTERAPDLSSLATLHRDELHAVKSVTITLSASRDAWREEWNRQWKEAEEPGRGFQPPEMPTGEVLFRLWPSNGLRVIVGDADRTNAIGLSQQLVTILNRGAGPLAWFDMNVLIAPLALCLAFAGLLLGPNVARALDLAEANGRWETAEVVGLIVGPIIGVALAVMFWRLLPTIELLDDGERSRWERTRGWFIGVVGTIILGLISIFIYEWITS